MSSSRSGAAGPVSVVNGCILEEAAYVRNVAGDRCCSSHLRAHEVGPHARTLAIFEVPIARRDAALSRRGEISVAACAHRAARLVPLEAGVAEDRVEAERLGLVLDLC